MYDDYDYYPSSSYERMAKTDPRSNYRPSEASATEGETAPRCYDCRFYQWGTCNLVEGTIEYADVCDLFTKQPALYPMNMADIAARGGGVDFFIEAALSKAPDWIQYWPAPGRFNHPNYGEIVITEERNQRIISNFKNEVYQKAIPVDCEHDLVTSGAVGWIDDMRKGDDGSIEAHVTWNERGTALIDQDRFRYFSPSIIPNWSHTVTGELIPDVAVGGAICTQPYFKESWLRPLVATEDGGLTTMERPRKPVQNGSARPVRVVSQTPLSRQEEVPMPEDKPVVTQFSEADAQAFREFQEKGGLAKFAALEQKAEQADKDIETLKQSAREARFTDLTKGVEFFADGSTKAGAPWRGERAKHLRILSSLAKNHGEDSEEFKDYLEVQRANAVTLSSKELGDNHNPEPQGAYETFMEKVENIRKSGDGKMSFQDASRQAAKDFPDLYVEYREAATVGI